MKNSIYLYGLNINMIKKIIILILFPILINCQVVFLSKTDYNSSADIIIVNNKMQANKLVHLVKRKELVNFNHPMNFENWYITNNLFEADCVYKLVNIQRKNRKTYKIYLK